MADDLSVSRVAEPIRDGGKPRAGKRDKRRATATKAAPGSTTPEDPPGEAPGDRHVDMLV